VTFEIQQGGSDIEISHHDPDITEESLEAVRQTLLDWAGRSSQEMFCGLHLIKIATESPASSCCLCSFCVDFMKHKADTA
jgi:hypothetical protein